MKKIFLLLFVCFTLVTMSVSYPQESDKINDHCPKLGDLARAIMKARQNEVPLSKAMENAESLDESDLKTIMKSMTLLAYEEPLYKLEDFRQRTINEFGNKFELLCYKSKQKNIE